MSNGINAVCPGIIATPMIERFTGGTQEGEQRVIAQERRQDGNTRGDRRSRHLAVSRCGSLCDRARSGHRRRPNGVLTLPKKMRLLRQLKTITLKGKADCWRTKMTSRRATKLPGENRVKQESEENPAPEFS